MRYLVSIKIAFRNILKNITQSAINIFGLGIGLGCIILITLLYLHENSFDRYIPDNQQVFRIIRGDDCRTAFPLGESVDTEIPAVETFFRYFQNQQFEIKNENNQVIKEELIACADPSIFDCLGIDFIDGKPAQLQNELAISETMAKRYFNSETAVGQILNTKLNNDFLQLTICGVYKDFPSNASITPNFIASTNLLGEFLKQQKKQYGQYGENYDSFINNWDRNIFHTYIKISSKANKNLVADQLQKYSEHFKEENEKQKSYALQPVTDIYLKSKDIGGDLFSRRGDANELKYYIAIALLILLIAMANYTFLYKAQMKSRMKEIGAQKSLGATNSSIFKQILIESNLISIISLAPAILVVVAGIPFINNILSRTLSMQVFSLWYTIPALIFITLFTGTFSGILAGFKISRTSSILLLNKKTSEIPKYSAWGNSFLSLHFTIFIILIVSALTLSKQIDFALNNFTAINPRNIIIGDLNTPELSQKFELIQNKIEKIPGVVKTAGSSFIPPFNGILPIRLKNDDEIITFDGMIMGKGMTELLGIGITEGEHFRDFQNGQVEIIVNESAALKYQLKAGDIFNGFKIRGVVKDFTAHTLHNPIQPMVIIQQHPEKMRLFAVKTTGNNNAAVKAKLTEILKEISPDAIPHVYSLIDEINGYYLTEQNQAKLIGAFSLIAILLSITGLLGMVMNMVSQRIKEIGIRKVNGAKVSEVLAMLNKDFVKWVAVAIIIGTPLAWYAMHKWLGNFAYKTQLSWWIFAFAGVLALVIALFTVSLQSWRAATRNPVEALRYE